MSNYHHHSNQGYISHKHKKHMARHHSWADGVLSVIEEFFDSLEDALEYALENFSSNYKVYDLDGNLCHSGGKPPGPSYA